MKAIVHCRYWDETYNFIEGAKKMGGKVLVHCKMGISRLAKKKREKKYVSQKKRRKKVGEPKSILPRPRP